MRCAVAAFSAALSARRTRSSLSASAADPSNDEVTTVGNEKSATAAVTSSPFVLARARAASAARARPRRISYTASWSGCVMSRYSAYSSSRRDIHCSLDPSHVSASMMALSSTSNAEHRSNMETSRRAEARPSRKRETSRRSASHRDGVGRGSASARSVSRFSTISARRRSHICTLSSSIAGADGVRCCHVKTPASGSTSRESVASKCQHSTRTITAGSDNPAGSNRLSLSTPNSAHAVPRRPLSRAADSPVRLAALRTSLCDAPSHTARASGSSAVSRNASSGGYASHRDAHAPVSSANALFALSGDGSRASSMSASTAWSKASARDDSSSSNVL